MKLRVSRMMAGLFALAMMALAPHAQAVDLSAAELAKVKAAEAARIATIDKVYGSVVAIYGNNRQGGGSGVIYDPAGYAVTNYHVVAGAGKEGWGGLADTKLYRWKLLGMDPGGDVAIIKLTGQESFPASTLGNSDHVRVGDFTMAMGNPFILADDQRPTVTLGVVSGIQRYQHGSTLTMLVYGNCIQVDSSINPGNSGGPLYNMRGEVIGINGRGSFKERGRVNVGVGYAISSEQVKNFIPELLATKTALHGTLDAVFGDRDEGVVCEQLNLDGDIAKLGLEPGDRLISFDGQPIRSAHDYTNLVSTLPAGWPVEVVFEHAKEKKTVWLRLPKLPYGAALKAGEKKPMPKRTPKPGGRKPQPKDQPEEKDPDAIEEPPVEMPKADPGRITDAPQNRIECRRVVEQYLAQIGAGKLDAAKLDTAKVDTAVKGFRWTSDIVRGGAKVGTTELVAARDGRWHVRFTLDGKPGELSFDGKRFWRREDLSAAPIPLAASLLKDEPLAIDALGLAGTLHADNLGKFAAMRLVGSDRTQRQRAYWLAAEVDSQRELYWWFSLFDETGTAHVRLLKASVGAKDGDDPDPADGAVTYHDWRAVDGVQLPHRRVIVTGLAETPQWELTTTQCAPVRELPPSFPAAEPTK